MIDHEHENSKYLAAYTVSVSGEPISTEYLREFLSTRLPDYMVPATFTHLEAIPLTVNGKLDRRALPEPVFSSEETYTRPRNEREEKLCAIWQEVLGSERVGVHDNFFRIGGNSIVAIRLISMCQDVLAEEITLAQLYTLKTIARISEELTSNTSDSSVQENVITL